MWCDTENVFNAKLIMMEDNLFSDIGNDIYEIVNIIVFENYVY